jgi:phosphatidate cytidylyltransferase
MLKKRLFTGFIVAILFLAAVWYGAPWSSVLLAVTGTVAVAEFYRHTGTFHIKPLAVFGMIWTPLLIISPHLASAGISQSMLLTVGLLASLILMIFMRQREKVFAAWAWMLGGALYLGWLLSYLIALQELTGGREWLFFALLTCAGGDSLAYFLGRACGKHRMAPGISPGKTWEGAFGNLLGTIIFGMGVFFLIDMPDSFTWPHALTLSVLVSIMGQLGDLAESLFKRNMNAKESGNTLPGHGGFMDRLDSIVFIGVVVYYYVLWIL